MYSLLIAIFHLKSSHARVCVHAHTCVLKRHFGIDISRLTEYFGYAESSGFSCVRVAFLDINTGGAHPTLVESVWIGDCASPAVLTSGSSDHLLGT